MVELTTMEQSESDDFESDSENDGDMFPENTTSDIGNNHQTKRKEPPLDSDIDSGEDETKGISGKKRRKLKKANEMKKLHKPPTVEELTRLRETENLFHSNLFRRQIEEMLKALELSEKQKVRVNNWLTKFNDWLSKMENSDEKFDMNQTDWLNNLQIKIPVSAFNEPCKGFYQFKKPAKISVVGSYKCDTMLGPGPIDIVIEMPRDFLQKEDYLNGRYHRKRAIYLYEIGRHLELKTDLVSQIKFVADEGETWVPLLEVVPAGKLSNKFTFLIDLVPEKGSFKLHRFVPIKNNVRPRWVFKNECTENEIDYPTPYYNYTMLRAMRMIDNHVSVETIVKESPQFRDAVILLKVWARQREFHLGIGAFNGFLVSQLLAYLLQIRKLHVTMSSYQILRTTWNYLITADWENCGITLNSGTSADQQPSMSDFHNHYQIVFVDPSGFLNFCSGMSSLIFKRLKDEAALALKYLDIPDINSFQVLFMTPVPFSRLCDQYISLHKAEAFSELEENISSTNRKIDNAGMTYYHTLEIIAPLLLRGLGNRIRALYLKQMPRRKWGLRKKPRVHSELAFGLLLNPEFCFTLVDKAPETVQTETSDFRLFWQERSELRRFKDGSITEAVVWKATTWSEKRMIARQIVDFILRVKCGLTFSNYRYIAEEVDFILPDDQELRIANVMSSYDTLTKQVRDLTGLPLDVISVQGTSPVFRYSDAFPPALPNMEKEKNVDKTMKSRCQKIANNLSESPKWCAPVEVLIQLGSSNKWPRDLEAIRRICAAFNIEIAKLLADNMKLVTQPYQNGLDVLTRHCVFRLRVVYPGEVALMKKTVSSDGVVQYRDTEESMKFEKLTFHLPKITSAMFGLHGQHSSFGTASCIAKRWVRSHLFDEGHVSDVALDLLMASVYLNSQPYSPPNQPQTAFMRFLYLLGHTNWSIQFILLNFNDELKRESIREIESFFDNHRSTLPPLFIATPFDTEKSIWTRDGPSQVVLHRLVGLAQRALLLLEKQLWGPIVPQIKVLFEPVFTVFDALVHLNLSFVPKRHQSINFMEEVHDDDSDSTLNRIPVVGFDPAEKLMSELRESYSEWALFFYDPYGGTTIGVLWKPSVQEPREVKVSHLHGRTWDREANLLRVNTKSILEGIKLLGSKLVKDVHVKQKENFVSLN